MLKFIYFLFSLSLALPFNALANPINSEQAKQIALKHAGISEQEAGFIKIEQEYDDGILQYEIEFWGQNTEFEYAVNANTGEIIEINQEHNRTDFTPLHPEQELLHTEQIKQIALKHAGLQTKDVRFVKISQEFKHGYSFYELKFWNKNTEYEYEIDAGNGKILEFSMEYH